MNYFKAYELVPKNIWDRYQEKSFMFLRREACVTLDKIRYLFGKPITVNNWKWGGELQYRGLRDDDFYIQQYIDYCIDNDKDPIRGEYSLYCYKTSEFSKSLSQHRLGNAFDFDVKGVTAEEARKAIKEWKQEGKLPHLTRMEKDVGWVHIDCVNVNVNNLTIVEFSP